MLANQIYFWISGLQPVSHLEEWGEFRGESVPWALLVCLWAWPQGCPSPNSLPAVRSIRKAYGVWGSWDGPISTTEDRRRTNVYWSPALCQAPYMLPHLVFTKTEISSPFYRLRQLRFRAIKKLTKGFLPPKWRSWGWSTFLSPKLMSFSHVPHRPVIIRFKAGLGGHATLVKTAGEGARVSSFRLLCTFSLTVS